MYIFDNSIFETIYYIVQIFLTFVQLILIIYHSRFIRQLTNNKDRRPPSLDLRNVHSVETPIRRKSIIQDASSRIV